MSEVKPLVLIADDDPRNHKLMHYLLGNDYRVESATGGEDALAKVEQLRPDVLLLDVMMPDLDGYEVCRRLRGRFMAHELPIIFVSAKNTLEERLQGFEVGGTDYFVKPFDHDALVACIRRIISYRAQAAANGGALHEAKQVAIEAMTSAAELGIVLRFAEASYAAADPAALAAQMFEATSSFGVSCSAMIQFGGECYFYGDKGAVAPIEESVLFQSQGKGRIFDFGNKTIFNYESISLIVKNMPINDPVRCGSLKDSLCYLLSEAQARIRALAVERQLRQQNENMVTLLDYTQRVIAELKQRIQHVRIEGVAVVEAMKEQMDKQVMKLSITDTEEAQLLAITDGGLEQTTALFSKGLQLDENLTVLTGELRVAAQSGEVTRIAELLQRVTTQ